jgi:hypothetical protein
VPRVEEEDGARLPPLGTAEPMSENVLPESLLARGLVAPSPLGSDRFLPRRIGAHHVAQRDDRSPGRPGER